MAAPNHLLFPIETSNRELDYRLALAVLAARDDNRVFIGLHETLMRLVRRLRGGVYLGKAPIEPHGEGTDALEDYLALKQRDFVFVHLDTEGAVYPGDERRWKKILNQRLDPRHLCPDDYVCTWGDFQRDVYRDLEPTCADNIRTTGHPRFDLYKQRWRDYYADDTARLRARFGDFILINTNFTHANNKMGTDFVFSPASGFDPDDLESRLDTVRDWAYMNELLGEFVRLVHRLHNVFPDIPIVVRPHPTEDPSLYRAAFRGLNSVDVLHEGPVGPWLLASRCMIHDGCTTGVEARFSDTNIINYRPVDAQGRQFFLPNLFGARCTTEDAVVDHLAELFDNPATEGGDDDTSADAARRAQRLLANFETDAFSALLDVLDEAQESVETTDAAPDAALLAEETVFEAIESLKGFVRPFLPRHRRAAEYSRRKFPGFDSDEIDRRLRRIESMTGQSVEHRVLSRGLMIVEKP